MSTKNPDFSWLPSRDRYPINPMEPTQAKIRVAFSFVERNFVSSPELRSAWSQQTLRLIRSSFLCIIIVSLAYMNLRHWNWETHSTAARSAKGTIDPVLVLLAIFNSVVSPIAVAGNWLVLHALWIITSVYPPSNLLLGCLALSDVLIGLCAQPWFAVSVVKSRKCARRTLILCDFVRGTLCIFALHCDWHPHRPGPVACPSFTPSLSHHCHF